MGVGNISGFPFLRNYGVNESFCFCILNDSINAWDQFTLIVVNDSIKVWDEFTLKVVDLKKFNKVNCNFSKRVIFNQTLKKINTEEIIIKTNNNN